MNSHTPQNQILKAETENRSIYQITSQRISKKTHSPRKLVPTNLKNSKVFNTFSLSVGRHGRYSQLWRLGSRSVWSGRIVVQGPCVWFSRRRPWPAWPVLPWLRRQLLPGQGQSPSATVSLLASCYISCRVLTCLNK